MIKYLQLSGSSPHTTTAYSATAHSVWLECYSLQCYGPKRVTRVLQPTVLRPTCAHDTCPPPPQCTAPIPRPHPSTACAPCQAQSSCTKALAAHTRRGRHTHVKSAWAHGCLPFRVRRSRVCRAQRCRAPMCIQNLKTLNAKVIKSSRSKARTPHLCLTDLYGYTPISMHSLPPQSLCKKLKILRYYGTSTTVLRY